MTGIGSRQVHLDFHTCEHIGAVGARFSSKQWQRALKTGRVDSINVFAKCHHGWSYYPTVVGNVHPTLKRDLMGLQIAKLMGAGKVLGSSTNPARRARLVEFGCDVAIDTTQPRWADQVLSATDGKGVDLIVDQVSASVANENLRACRILGRIVNVGRLGGRTGDFDFDLHAARRIDYIGVTFRTRSVEEVREVTRLMRADVWPALEAGKLSLPIDRVFKLDEVEAAVGHMRANQHFGKIIMVP